jgi:hypothetical protein
MLGKKMNFRALLIEAYREKKFSEYPAHDKQNSQLTDKHNYFNNILSHELSQVHSHFIRGYTNVGYSESNSTLYKALQKNTIADAVNPDHVTNDTNPLEQIIHVHNALKTFPPAPESFHVYSGIKSGSLTDSIKNDNGYIHIPSFFSTTLDPTIAHKFSTPDYASEGERHILRIKINKGQQVGGYIQPYSEHPKEEEFLMNANHVLHIKQSTKMKDNRGNDIIVHDAEILSPNQIKRIPKEVSKAIIEYHTHAQKLNELFKKDVNTFPMTSTINEYANTSDQNKLINIFDETHPEYKNSSYLAKTIAMRNKTLTDNSISKIIKHASMNPREVATLLKHRATKEHISDLIDTYTRLGYLRSFDISNTISKMKNFDATEHYALHDKIKMEMSKK